MRLSTISGKAWREFAERFPAAEAFLLAASLRGELRELEAAVARESEYQTGTWTATRAKRLRELREWAARTAGGGA